MCSMLSESGCRALSLEKVFSFLFCNSFQTFSILQTKGSPLFTQSSVEKEPTL